MKKIKLIIIALLAVTLLGSCTKGGKSYEYLECVTAKEEKIEFITNSYNIKVSSAYQNFLYGSISESKYLRLTAEYAEEMQNEIAVVNETKCELD